MANSLLYCHICGSIMERQELSRLVYKDHITKKRKTLYHVCGKCLHNLSRRRYKMNFFANNKIIHTYRLFAEPMTRGKSVQLYDLMDAQLEVVKNLEVKKEKLKLITKDNRRIWTVFNVRNLIETNDVEMLKLMSKLFEYQTDDEKRERKTRWQNAVGFNQADASFLTGMSEKYEKQGQTKSVFTERQLHAIRKRMLKYAQQITIILNT